MGKDIHTKRPCKLLRGLNADRAAPIVSVPRYHLPGGYEGEGAEVRGVGLWSNGLIGPRFN